MSDVQLKLRGISQKLEGIVLNDETIEIDQTDYQIDTLPLDVPIQGTVYGALLNFKGAYDQLAPKMNEAPYQNPPKAPVLYIKPKNTYISAQQLIPLPVCEEFVEVGAALAIVIGKVATKVKEEEALDYVLGYTIANDVSIPHESVHRPAVKYKARDGFLPVGPWIVQKESVENPNDLQIKVSINGEVKQENTTKNLLRSVEKLLADVTDYMTLNEGDVLLVGVPENAPLAKEDDLVTIEIDQIGKLENRVVSEKHVLGGEIV